MSYMTSGTLAALSKANHPLHVGLTSIESWKEDLIILSYVDFSWKRIPVGPRSICWSFVRSTFMFRTSEPLRYHCTFFASFFISKSLRFSWKQIGRNLNTNDKGHLEVSYPVQKNLNLFLNMWKFWTFLKRPFFPGVQNR